MTKEWPAWRYGLGEDGQIASVICNTVDDVPAGWVDSPAKVGSHVAEEAPEPAPKKKAPSKKKAAQKVADADGDN